MSKNKVVLLGTTHAGKTSIVQRYINGQFTTSTIASTQAAFFQKTVETKEKEIVLDIWDTAGQERFRSLAPVYYRDACGAVVVYDITDANSFSKAKQWINELKSARGDQVVICLVGNKLDLQFIRVVQTTEAKQYAKLAGASYFETSAKTGSNIDQVFEDIALKIEENMFIEMSQTVSEAQLKTKKQSSGCC